MEESGGRGCLRMGAGDIDSGPAGTEVTLSAETGN